MAKEEIHGMLTRATWAKMALIMNTDQFPRPLVEHQLIGPLA